MSKTKDRIRESNLRYKQSLGQNFLYDENLLAELIAEARRRKEEEVYTIDPSLCFCCGRCYAACPLERKEKTHEK